MSANPSDDALQRLNYFNGQRLAAADFRAEQGHHMGMRRVLNRSLYSPGIVVGLEVVPVPQEVQPARSAGRAPRDRAGTAWRSTTWGARSSCRSMSRCR